ncbi:MAG: DeoR/GlpR transcriptional regulator [Chitinophagaceae bacterium]|nr:MAG: DeoR/GlpR transcriptional regulator [Chitinophagaceae bacterium]
MLREERFEKILRSAKKTGKADYEILAEQLTVSPDTVRRDIDTLCRNGLLVKVRGGAILPSKNPLSFSQRSNFLTNGKNIIALKAQQFITEDSTLFFDGGTTNCSIASQISNEISCRIITNNYAMVPLLAAKKNIELILTGGTYDHINQTVYGDQALSMISEFVADIYFLGTCAIDPSHGITAAFQHEAAVKRNMKKFSKRTIALANQEKLGSVDPFRICDIKDLQVIISDVPADSPLMHPYRGKGPLIL